VVRIKNLITGGLPAPSHPGDPHHRLLGTPVLCILNGYGPGFKTIVPVLSGSAWEFPQRGSMKRLCGEQEQ